MVGCRLERCAASELQERARRREKRKVWKTWGWQNKVLEKEKKKKRGRGRRHEVECREIFRVGRQSVILVHMAGRGVAPKPAGRLCLLVPGAASYGRVGPWQLDAPFARGAFAPRHSDLQGSCSLAQALCRPGSSL